MSSVVRTRDAGHLFVFGTAGVSLPPPLALQLSSPPHLLFLCPVGLPWLILLHPYPSGPPISLCHVSTSLPPAPTKTPIIVVYASLSHVLSYISLPFIMLAKAPKVFPLCCVYGYVGSECFQWLDIPMDPSPSLLILQILYPSFIFFCLLRACCSPSLHLLLPRIAGSSGHN